MGGSYWSGGGLGIVREAVEEIIPWLSVRDAPWPDPRRPTAW